MKYPIELFWSDEDESWIAVVPDLPGCSAVGTTPEQAAAEVLDAIEAWIVACHAAGDPVPEPSSGAIECSMATYEVAPAQGPGAVARHRPAAS